MSKNRLVPRWLGGKRGDPLLGLLLAVVLSISSVATAPASAADEEPRGWTPALRLGMGVHSQGLDGDAFSPDALVSPSGAPGDSIVTIGFRGGMRLYAPEDLLPSDSWTAPRLFLTASVDVPLDDGFIASRYDSNFDINDTFEPGVSISEFCPNAPPTQSCVYSSRTKLDLLVNFSAGIGAEFQLPIAEGQFHVSTTLEYFGQSVETEGTYSLESTASLGVSAESSIAEKSSSETLHGISTGLALGVDVYDNEWIAARFFVESKVAWILSDREVDVRGPPADPPDPFATVFFRVRPSGFLVTGGAGMEFRWAGGP